MTTSTGCFSIIAGFAIGLRMTLGVIANANLQQNAYDQTRNAILLTNTFVLHSLDSTHTATAWTPTPSSTPTVAK
jgi:hypothetical protein